MAPWAVRVEGEFGSYRCCLHNNAIVARGILVAILYYGTPEPRLSAIYIVSSVGTSLVTHCSNFATRALTARPLSSFKYLFNIRTDTDVSTLRDNNVDECVTHTLTTRNIKSVQLY